MLAELALIIQLCSVGAGNPTQCHNVDLIARNCGGSTRYTNDSGGFNSCFIKSWENGSIEVAPGGTAILRGGR